MLAELPQRCQPQALAMKTLPWWPCCPASVCGAGGIGDQVVLAWLAALARKPAHAPSPRWGFCLLGGDFCTLRLQSQQGCGWLSGPRSGRFLSHMADLNAVVWVFPLSHLDHRGAGWEHFNYKGCSINRLQMQPVARKVSDRDGCKPKGWVLACWRGLALHLLQLI